MGYHSAIKRNAILMHITAWIKFKNVMVSAGGQTWKTTCCMMVILSMCNSRKSVVAWNGEVDRPHKGHKKNLSRMLEQSYVLMVTVVT